MYIGISENHIKKIVTFILSNNDYWLEILNRGILENENSIDVKISELTDKLYNKRGLMVINVFDKNGMQNGLLSLKSIVKAIEINCITNVDYLDVTRYNEKMYDTIIQYALFGKIVY